MQNTSCCASCESLRRTRDVSIFGKNVRVKDYICSPDGIHYRRKEENIQLQLVVCPTSFCPAGCPFCIATRTDQHRRIDIARFEKVMRLLKEEIGIRGVKITGGEPFYDVVLLSEVISVLFEVFGLSLEISVSTNGMWLDQLRRLPSLEYIEAIHISRHHYDDAANRSLFGGAAVPDGSRLKEIIGTVSFRDLFVLNCMLLKDHINSPEEAHRFLDFAIDVGAPKVGFMTCTPVNGYARTQSIPFESVIREDDPSLLFTRGFFDYEFCHCRDGVYVSPAGELVEFYGRSTNNDGCDYSRGLLYDSDDHLWDAFGGNVIL